MASTDPRIAAANNAYAAYTAAVTSGDGFSGGINYADAKAAAKTIEQNIISYASSMGVSTSDPSVSGLLAWASERANNTNSNSNSDSNPMSHDRDWYKGMHNSDQHNDVGYGTNLSDDFAKIATASEPGDDRPELGSQVPQVGATGAQRTEAKVAAELEFVGAQNAFNAEMTKEGGPDKGRASSLLGVLLSKLQAVQGIVGDTLDGKYQGYFQMAKDKFDNHNWGGHTDSKDDDNGGATFTTKEIREKRGAVTEAASKLQDLLNGFNPDPDALRVATQELKDARSAYNLAVGDGARDKDLLGDVKDVIRLSNQMTGDGKSGEGDNTPLEVGGESLGSGTSGRPGNGGNGDLSKHEVFEKAVQGSTALIAGIINSDGSINASAVNNEGDPKGARTEYGTIGAQQILNAQASGAVAPASAYEAVNAMTRPDIQALRDTGHGELADIATEIQAGAHLSAGDALNSDMNRITTATAQGSGGVGGDSGVNLTRAEFGLVGLSAIQAGNDPTGSGLAAVKALTPGDLKALRAAHPEINWDKVEGIISDDNFVVTGADPSITTNGAAVNYSSTPASIQAAEAAEYGKQQLPGVDTTGWTKADIDEYNYIQANGGPKSTPAPVAPAAAAPPTAQSQALAAQVAQYKDQQETNTASPQPSAPGGIGTDNVNSTSLAAGVNIYTPEGAAEQNRIMASQNMGWYQDVNGGAGGWTTLRPPQ